MVMTVILSLGPSFNVIMVLMLILYIYGVAGMQFYGNLEDCEQINDLENFRNIFTSMMFLFQISTGQDFKSIMFDIRAQDGFAVTTFFISFYIVSIFVFLNLFIAVLLEAFEREFDDSIELDLTAEDLLEFKNSWDTKCQDLLLQGLTEPKRGRCGQKDVHSALPVAFLREFMEELPERSALGGARDIGDKVAITIKIDEFCIPNDEFCIKNNDLNVNMKVVWWNRLLYELSIQDGCSMCVLTEMMKDSSRQKMKILPLCSDDLGRTGT